MNDYFKRVTPESEGVSSQWISETLNFIKEKRFDIHGLMIVRHGKVLAEGYSEPFHKGFQHRLYSCSKTFVALAVGKLIGEGRLRLEDKLIDFFTEFQEGCDEEIANTTVENALTMQVAIPGTTYSDVVGGVLYPKVSGWDRSSFVVKSDIPNGRLFRYNTSASYLLNVIVEKITGQTFLEYLRPEFDEIGVSKDIYCVTSPDGYSWGGSGVVATLEDFAKVGNLMMHLGNHDGKQLLPYDYMVKATSKMVETPFNGTRMWDTCGYGYQIWLEPNGFGMHGMLGQMIHCFPEKDMLVAYHAGFLGNSAAAARALIYNWMERIYKKAEEQSLPEDAEHYEQLQTALSEMSLGMGYGQAHSPMEAVVADQKYLLKDNPMGIKWVQFSFEQATGTLTYENRRGVKSIPFGYEEYASFEMPERYSGKQIGTMMDKGYDAMALGSWVTEHSFILKLCIVDIYFGGVIFYFDFQENALLLNMNQCTEYYMFDYQGTALGKAESKGVEQDE